MCLGNEKAAETIVHTLTDVTDLYYLIDTSTNCTWLGDHTSHKQELWHIFNWRHLILTYKHANENLIVSLQDSKVNQISRIDYKYAFGV